MKLDARRTDDSMDINENRSKDMTSLHYTAYTKLNQKRAWSRERESEIETARMKAHNEIAQKSSRKQRDER